MLSKKFTAVAGAAAEATDDYFKNVSLLLSGDGTNGAQNNGPANPFLDSSTNNFSITRNGNTTQGTFTPYGDLWSNYLPSTANIAVSAANAAFALGTGDFTIEGWFNLTNPTYAQGLFHINTAVSGTVNGYAVGVTSAGLVQFYSGTTYTTTNTTLSASTWYHIALVRSSGTVKVYVNGVNPASGGSIADSQNLGNSVCYVGVFYSTSGYTMTGYASNFRVVKGTAVYTTDFTPPTTPLTAIANTSFLTCQSNRFIDNSTNALSLTLTGTPSVQRFSPFNPTAAYSTATIGGSGYFDGSGDYLSYTGGSTTTLSGDYTVEAWVYLNNLSAAQPILCIGDDYYSGLGFFVNTSGKLYMYGNGAAVATGTGTSVTANTWTHVAFVRSGSTITLYVNGVSQGTATNSSTYSGTTTLIGREVYSGSVGVQYSGYISNFRLVNGTAVYTSSFTPTTTPLTAISGTSLLLDFTNAGIPDSAMMNDLETVGNAQVSTSVKKYGTGSIAFDGTGDYLTTPTSPALNVGSSPIWTIEFWGYVGTSFGTFCPISMVQDGTTRWDIEVGATTTTVLFNNTTATTFTNPSTLASNTWFHMAFVRDGTTVKMYINGVASVTTTTSNVSSVSTATLTYIGRNNVGGYYFDWNGYIDDFRITKGYARYTTTFTPPTEAFPTY